MSSNETVSERFLKSSKNNNLQTKDTLALNLQKARCANIVTDILSVFSLLQKPVYRSYVTQHLIGHLL